MRLYGYTARAQVVIVPESSEMTVQNSFSDRPFRGLLVPLVTLPWLGATGALRHQLSRLSKASGPRSQSRSRRSLNRSVCRGTLTCSQNSFRDRPFRGLLVPLATLPWLGAPVSLTYQRIRLSKASEPRSQSPKSLFRCLWKEVKSGPKLGWAESVPKKFKLQPINKI